MKALFLPLLLAAWSAAFADIPVVFPDNDKFADAVGDEFMVESTIPGDFKTPEGVAAAMLMLGDQVADKKLTAPFNPATIRSSSHFEGARPLASYFRGARIQGKRFIISFDGEAMRYLNNAASIQQFVKGAIEGTLKKNFPEIEGVDYEVDGEIVEDWDA